MIFERVNFGWHLLLTQIFCPAERTTQRSGTVLWSFFFFLLFAHLLALASFDKETRRVITLYGLAFMQKISRLNFETAFVVIFVGFSYLIRSVLCVAVAVARRTSSSYVSHHTTTRRDKTESKYVETMIIWWPVEF